MFPYELTPDQEQSVKEITADMESPRNMDRLLCGDVGFGKTEVALRAAFKCVMGGKQCAILAPTTILAWQHFNTALTRMESFPIRIGLLSRYRTAKEQKETLRGLKDGTSSKVHPTRDGIMSISASPMENKILSDIGLLPFCIQVCRKVRQCSVYTRRALCATASFIR